MKYIVLWALENMDYINGSRAEIDLILLCYIYNTSIDHVVLKAIDKRDVQITDNDFLISTGYGLVLQ